MPTVAQLKSAKNKLQKPPTKSMKNAPVVPNRSMYNAIKADARIQRMKQAMLLIEEMKWRRKQYNNAKNALKKLNVI